MENLHILILAAGKGTRMKSGKAKVLHQVGGASLLEHVYRTAATLSRNIVIVAGHQAETVKRLLPDATFADQTEQLGTGHAVLCAKTALVGFGGNLLVLPGDVPLVSGQTLREFIAFHEKGGFTASVLTAEVDNPHGYGRIVRAAGGNVERIVEQRDASPQVLAVREVNSSIYVFKTSALFEALSKVQNKNAQGEYYLTDVIGILASQNARIGAWKAVNPSEILGINTRQELAEIDQSMRLRKCDALMTGGVTILDAKSTFIDEDVEIGADSIIYPSVQIEKGARLGENVTVRSFSRISNCRIGDGSTVLEGCVLIDSAMGRNVSIGPFAHIRGGAELDDTVDIGNFVEIKKSKLGRGTKSKHLAYIGDATVGRNVNIGAGVITVNYDGIHKNPTFIEDEAFIGSDSTLIAPVRVERGGFVAAGSTITDDVPAEALAIARGRQVNKEGRAPHLKKKKQ